MLSREITLDLANAGLGGLTEVVALRLFANVQAERITEGTGITLPDIVDQAGNALYPGFYKTELEVPAPLLFRDFRTWQRIALGADVRRFGRMILDSRLALGRPGEVGEDPEGWGALVRLHGSVMFVVDGGASVSSPKEGMTAELPPMTARPPAMDELRKVRERGLADDAKLTGTFDYAVTSRDVPPNRAMMFSTFTTILDVAEEHFLTNDLWASRDLVPLLQTTSRTVYYLDNVGAGQSIRVSLRARLSPFPKEQPYGGAVGAAMLEHTAELRDIASRALVAVASTRKVVVVPRDRATLAQDAVRLVHQHGDSR